MNRRAIAGLVLLVFFVLALVALLDTPGDRPSVRSPLPDGYRAAFRYLEERGYVVAAWQRPLDELDDPRATLIIAAPFSRGLGDDEERALETWMRSGGTLVFLPSGRADTPNESLLLLDLGLSLERLDDAEPLAWSAWSAWKRGRETLTRVAGEDAWPGAPETLHTRRATQRVNQPGGARTLYVDEDDAPVVFEIPRGEGRLVVINDASMLSNALIGESGNLALLELIASETSERSEIVLFDEWRQGYADPGTETALTTGAFEILVAHVLVVYLAAVWALGRRFGPRLVEARRLRGSVARDLLSIAALHQRGGHARESGELMLSRARLLARGRAGLAELPETFEGGEAELDALARRIARLQAEGKL